MLKMLLQRLTKVNPWHFLWIGVVIAELFTAVMTSILSIIWWGEISIDLLLIGSIDAFVVAFLVIGIVLFFTNKVKETEAINVRLSEALEDRLKFEKEKKRLQDQLHQSQKMEMVGRLAGGIAHDFNNILTIIIGYSEFVLEDLPEGSKLSEDVALIKDAGLKAEALTRQLLAFSRKQVLEMKVVNLDTIVQDMAKMIRRVLGEDIDFQIKSSDVKQNTYADPGQIEQVLLNLAVNSRDAMPDGGNLAIEISNISFDSENDNYPAEMLPGKYILVSFVDNGCGMTPDVLDKIFEPFFTTKEKGKGTGLGLATVYGIVKQHNGYIYVVSELKKGTKFTMYLPVSDKLQAPEEEFVDIKKLGGDETILIVEDEESLRQYVIDVLRPRGYYTMSAENGEKALVVSRESEKNIHLLLTDVIMPGMNGKELADKLLAERPGLKVIFMSGYSDDLIAHHGVLDKGINLLQKPVRAGLLEQKIREVLDS